MNGRIPKLALAALAVLLTCGATLGQDTERFRQEYGVLNGAPTDDGLHVYLPVAFDGEVAVCYTSFPDVQTLLDGGTGVLYMGFPKCPWCRALLPALFDAAARQNYAGPVLYYNALALRDIRSLDDSGNIVVEREAAPEYIKLLDRLDGWLGAYEGLDDPSIKRIYFPTTVFVRDGEVLSVHTGTLNKQSDPYAPLEAEMYEQLVAALEAQVAAITQEPQS